MKVDLTGWLEFLCGKIVESHGSQQETKHSWETEKYRVTQGEKSENMETWFDARWWKTFCTRVKKM